MFNFYYIYDLPFWQATRRRSCGHVLGGWQISGSTFMRTGTPLWVTRERRHRRHRRHRSRSRYNLVGDPNANSNGQFSAGAGKDQNFWFNPAAFARPAAGTFGNAPRDNIYNPGQYQWDIALFKNVSAEGTRRRSSSARRSSTSSTTRT